MPVSISRRGDEYCVVEPDGGVVKCHPTRGEALAHMRAINANVDKANSTNARSLLEGKIHQSFTVAADELLMRGYVDRDQRIELSSIIGSVLGEFGEMSEEVLGNTVVDEGDVEAIANKSSSVTGSYVETFTGTSTDDAADGSVWIKSDFIEEECEDCDGANEKGFSEVVVVQEIPTSFAELDEAREKYEASSRIRRMVAEFKELAENIFSRGSGDEAKEVRQLAKEFAERMGHEEEEEEGMDEEKAEKAAPTKTEGGVAYKSKDFACVPDPQKPSTWKLRLAEGRSGNITVKQLGRAAAAFSPGGFRGNRVELPSGCSSSAVKSRIKSEYRKLGVDAEDMPDSIKAKLIEPKSQFMIWKQDDGQWRWFGIYSNKFRDNDRPAEILSEKAHIEFAERVEKGELDYPDLYVWHIPAAVGKADLVAYEESGFAIVTGLFTHEGVAKALSKSGADLAMSHGMPVAYIKRDDDDPTVIVSYVSEEVSVLPRDVAANKMTDFVVLKEDESMAIIPQEKRSQVVDLLGEDLTADLETSLSNRGKSAEDAGIEFKEEEAAEVVEETAPEAVVETEAEIEVEETVEETAEAEIELEVETVEEADVVSKEEMAETLAAVVGAFQDSMSGVVDRLEQIEKSVTDIKKEEGEKLAEEVANSPSASLAAKLAEALAAKDTGTVIGTPEAHVHGNKKLAKDGPEQTPVDEAGEFNGLFFQQWTGR